MLFHIFIMFKFFRSYFLVILSLSLVIPLYSFVGGTGTLVDPYRIGNCSDLQDMNTDYGANYTLDSDIDCGVPPYNTGSGFAPIGHCTGVCWSGDDDPSFTGSFNGGGKNISNLFINRTTSEYIGLFGRASYATISNVGLKNVNIVGLDNVGGLVGGYASDVTIDNSFVIGLVSGNNYIGGLVGDASNTIITSSYVSGSVSGNFRVGGFVGYANLVTVDNSYDLADVSGINTVGGLIGNNYHAYNNSPNYYFINNSYSVGNVSGTNYVGGLIGTNGYFSIVSNSYSIGNVSGTTYVGGLVGYNKLFTSITNSYWLNSSGNPSGGLGVDNNAQSVTAESSISYFYGNSNSPMSGWDTNVWDFDNSSSPHLAFENYAFSVPVPPSSSSGGSGLTGLPSFGFYSLIVSSVLLFGFLFI